MRLSSVPIYLSDKYIGQSTSFKNFPSEHFRNKTASALYSCILFILLYLFVQFHSHTENLSWGLLYTERHDQVLKDLYTVALWWGFAAYLLGASICSISHDFSILCYVVQISTQIPPILSKFLISKSIICINNPYPSVMIKYVQGK